MTAGSVQTILRDALGLHQMGRLGEAEKLYRALDKDPKNFDALHRLGRIKIQQGRQHEAIPLLSAAVKRNPRSADALMLLGSTQIALGRLDEALSRFERAATAEPNNHQVLFNRAVALVSMLRDRRSNDGQPMIGLSWVSKNQTIGRVKSARLRDFEALLRLPGYRFVDLQYGDTIAERDEVERALGVRVERLDDIDNTTIWTAWRHSCRRERDQSWSDMIAGLVPDVVAAAALARIERGSL